MAVIRICDLRSNGEPCTERALISGNFKWEGKTFEFDACEVHMRILTETAREAESPATPSPYTRTTQLPRSEPKTRKVSVNPISKEDVKDARAWLESNGDLPQNSRGRIASTLAEKWLSEGSPRQRADGTFIKSD